MNFFKKIEQSHSAKKFKRGDSLVFFNIQSVTKYQKVTREPFGHHTAESTFFQSTGQNSSTKF